MQSPNHPRRLPPNPLLRALNPGDADQEKSPEEDSGLTGAASVLNPGSAEAAEVRDPVVEEPPTPESVRVEPAAEDDEARPLSSTLLGEAQGVKRNRTGGSKAGSSTGGSWTLADLDRLSSASTMQVPDSVAGAPPAMHSLCRVLARLCRDHSGDERAAKAIRTLVASVPLGHGPCCPSSRWWSAASSLAI